MKNKLIVEISEGFGNQLFMYAHAYALSKKLSYDLLIDNTSGYSRKKNLLRPHQKFMLDCLNINGNFAESHLKYDTSLKKILKKILVLLDNFSLKKKYLIEKSIKINDKKIVNDNINFNKIKFSNQLYVQGNFENYKFFENFRNHFIKIFKPKNNLVNLENPLINNLKNTNSVSIHIRRNRFSDQSNLSNDLKNIEQSNIFTNQTINYINNSIKYIKDKVVNPKFFIWSNDFNNFDEISNKIKIPDYTLVKNNDVINDFYLLASSKHFIVGPSSFHWWGAWLNENPDKICLRPANINPSNNKNFWPENWIVI